MASLAISFELIERIREFYTMAYQEISLNERKQATHDNGITEYAIPSYILSVASVEAFMNEMFLGTSLAFLKGSSLDELSGDKLRHYQKTNLGDKLLHLTELAFDKKVFIHDHQPFLDMVYLIKVRDSFVHYKMGIEPEYEDAFNYLVNEGIALKSPNSPSKFWVSDLSTIEGIRWAHNTVLQIITSIIDTAIITNRHPILISMGTQTKDFFNQIPNPNEMELWIAWMNSHTKWIKINSSIVPRVD
jgi:hypothetical protein